MKFIVNGETRDVSAVTLGALLRELDYQGNWLATALNGEVVPAKERSGCQLSEGDRIEILSPMKGG
jgi:sulfur carrier protein